MKSLRLRAKQMGLTGLVLVASLAVLIAWAWTAVAPDPVEEVANALSPDPGVVALDLCQKPDLVVNKILVPSGNYFTAVYTTESVRYDLTWQELGTSIAVERTRARDFDIWAEQMTPEFQACIDGHQVTIREGTH